MRLPEARQVADEGGKIDVGGEPVEPGDVVVLGIGIVVAALGAAELVAGGQHRRAARDEERGEQARTSTRRGLATSSRRVGALDAVVPREVLVVAVAVVLAVRLVVLALVGDEVERA